MEIEALLEALLLGNENIVILKAQNARKVVIRANEEMNFHLQDIVVFLHIVMLLSLSIPSHALMKTNWIYLMKAPRTWSAIRIVTRQKVS